MKHFGLSRVVQKILPFAFILVFLIPAMAEAIDVTPDHSVCGWVIDGAQQNTDGTVSVTIMEVPDFTQKAYTTAISLADPAHTNPITGVTRADSLVNDSKTTSPSALSDKGVLDKNAFAEVIFNAAGQCIDMEVVEFSAVTFMDSASYGGELTARGGGSGDMVATGWLLAKDKANKTITIGDGNHVTNVFEETYTLTDDCKIFLVDNPSTDGKTPVTAGLDPKYTVSGSWNLIKKGGFDDINLCQTTNGEIYYSPQRWTALCIFDHNYKSSWKTGAAKVRELYLFNNPIILAKKDLATPDGMQYDGTSWYPYTSKRNEKTWFSFTGSAEPIEIMKNRLYDVGDTYTDIYLFVGDDGTLSLLDQGNRVATYQYWLNIAKLGFNPRSVDNIVLTHGHADHYQALYENCLMIRRAGGNVDAYINPYAQGASVENSNYKLVPTLTDKPVLYSVNRRVTWDTWLKFMGKGVDIYAWRSIGHSDDTASYIFKLKATKDDTFFKKEDVVSWVYFGGYGAQANLKTGYRNLALMSSLQYEQSVIVPWAEAQSNYIYCLPQHTNQYPLHEIYKASKIAKIPVTQALSEGSEAISNFCEKRISVQLYEWMDKAYRNKTDTMGNMLEQAGVGFRCDSLNSVNIDTVEAHGPYKRPEGEYTIKIQGISVIHGFDAFLNKTPLFANQKNVYGFSLDKGFLIDKDSCTHDPDGWYIQVICRVNDGYDGGVNYDTNWYKGHYVAGPKDEPIAKPWDSGPVEITISPTNWTETLRTQRFASREQAEAYAKALTNNTYTTPYEGYGINGLMYKYVDNADYAITDHDGRGSAPSTASYKVRLNRASEIMLGDSFESTFSKVNE